VQPVQHGITRMYYAFRSENTPESLRRIFNDRAAALAWLNEGQPPEKHLK